MGCGNDSTLTLNALLLSILTRYRGRQMMIEKRKKMRKQEEKMKFIKDEVMEVTVESTSWD